MPAISGQNYLHFLLMNWPIIASCEEKTPKNMHFWLPNLQVYCRTNFIRSYLRCWSHSTPTRRFSRWNARRRGWKLAWRARFQHCFDILIGADSDIFRIQRPEPAWSVSPLDKIVKSDCWVLQVLKHFGDINKNRHILQSLYDTLVSSLSKRN